MRPLGEVSQAILRAVDEIATPDRGATLVEITHRAQLGGQAARNGVANLCRSGALCIARSRRVDYRNRPVAEYAPAGAPSGNGPTLCSVWAAR